MYASLSSRHDPEFPENIPAIPTGTFINGKIYLYSTASQIVIKTVPRSRNRKAACCRQDEGLRGPSVKWYRNFNCVHTEVCMLGGGWGSSVAVTMLSGGSYSTELHNSCHPEDRALGLQLLFWFAATLAVWPRASLLNYLISLNPISSVKWTIPAYLSAGLGR